MPFRLFISLIRLVRAIPLLHRAVWKLRRGFHASRRMVLVRRRVVAADALLRDVVIKSLPYSAGKIGSVEASALAAYLTRRKAVSKGLQPARYGRYLSGALHVNAGVFPQTEDAYDRFGDLFVDAVSQCDMLVSWDVAGEAEILSGHCRGAQLVHLDSLEPFFAPDPWTSALEGKRVLVISPFVDSIRQQYDVRSSLWDNPKMLPPFELYTLRAPLSAALVTPEDKDWFSALDRMKQIMNAMDFDVALIGAGAYSIPLAVHAKMLKRVGVHLGGGLQILFGVYGSRWEKKAAYKSIIKKSWVRPTGEETPALSVKIEDGCYW